MIILVAASGFSVGRVEDQPSNVAGQLTLYPNIETMGVAVNDVSLPNTAQLLYRRQGETAWRTGHSLVRIDDGRLIGSLFGLVAGTMYEVKVAAGTVEYSSVATTQPDELDFTPSVVLHVNDDASTGGDGSAAAPFQTIQEAVNRAGPGTSNR